MSPATIRSSPSFLRFGDDFEFSNVLFIQWPLLPRTTQEHVVIIPHNVQNFENLMINSPFPAIRGGHTRYDLPFIFPFAAFFPCLPHPVYGKVQRKNVLRRWLLRRMDRGISDLSARALAEIPLRRGHRELQFDMGICKLGLE